MKSGKGNAPLEFPDAVDWLCYCVFVEDAKPLLFGSILHFIEFPTIDEFPLHLLAEVGGNCISQTLENV